MKKIILISALLTSACFADAQLTHHFPHSNAVWGHFLGVYVDVTFGNDYYNGGSFYYTAQGDTSIGGANYIKIYVSDSGGINLYGPPRMIREEQEQVYYFDPFTLSDLLLYDFSLQPGETAEVYTDYPFTFSPTVDSIGTILTGSQERKCLYFNHNSAASVLNHLMFGEELKPLIWIEGIGSIDGPFAPYGGPDLIDGIAFLTCFKENDTLKFGEECNVIYAAVKDVKVESNLSVFPNPTSGAISVELPDISGKQEVAIYSLPGKEMWRKEIKTASGTTENIDMSAYADGIYLLTIRSQSGIFHQKIEVSKK